MFKCIIVNIHIFNGFPHSRNHSHHIFQISHFFNLVYLFQEIIKIECIFCQFLLKPFCLFLIKLFLCFFNQRNDIAHSKDSVRHTIGVKNIQCIQLFTRPDKFNWFFNYSTNGKRRTTPRITIKFGKNNTIKIKPIIKFFGSIYSILACH